jgi:hypothetical protein
VSAEKLQGTKQLKAHVTDLDEYSKTMKVAAWRTLGGPGSGWYAEGGHVPGSQSGVRYVFHGTTLEQLQNIESEGLKTSHAGKVFEFSEAGHIYAATTSDSAKGWAESVAAARRLERIREGKSELIPVVVSVRIPADRVSDVQQDDHFDPYDPKQKSDYDTARKFKGDIPPEWITHISVKGKKGWGSWKAKTSTKRAAEESVVVYVPMLLDEYAARALGGAGSGNFGHGGRPGEKGGSAEGGGARSERSVRALKHFIPVHAESQRHAERNELKIRSMIGGKRTDDNKPVDVVVTIDGRTVGVEVKTMINNTNDKITVRKAALEKKTKWAKEHKASVHTVVVDDRGRFGHKEYSGHRIYHSEGSGSFRLTSMTKVKDAKHLKELLSK